MFRRLDSDLPGLDGPFPLSPSQAISPTVVKGTTKGLKTCSGKYTCASLSPLNIRREKAGSSCRETGPMLDHILISFRHQTSPHRTKDPNPGEFQSSEAKIPQIVAILGYSQHQSGPHHKLIKVSTPGTISLPRERQS
jgi:hypothetical protein